MTFEEYCQQKKINASAFKKADPEQFSNLKSLFEQIHPESFTAQKLFLINNIRRTYPVGQSDTGDEASAAKPKKAKPKINIPKK